MPGLAQLLSTGSFNGLAWGPGTSYHVSAVSGLEDLPALRSSDVAKAADTGVYRGRDFLGGRTLTLDFAIIADDNASYLAACDALERATVPSQTAELPLTISGGTRLMNCRVRRRAVPYEAGYARRTGTARVEWFASDPRVYDASLTAPIVGLPVASAGLGPFPVTFTVTFGTAGAGTVQVVNSGNWPTPPVVTFSGPVANPGIMNLNTGEYVQSAISLSVTDSLAIDMAAHTITLNGTGARRSTMVNGSRFWNLAPGTTTVQYFASNQTSSTATVTFRSAWV